MAQNSPLTNLPLPASEQVSPTSASTLSAPSVKAHYTQKVIERLRTTVGGAELDNYFGITSGIPIQSPKEAAESDLLINELKSLRQGDRDSRSLLIRIADHTARSGADPEALRALRNGRRKQELH